MQTYASLSTLSIFHTTQNPVIKAINHIIEKKQLDSSKTCQDDKNHVDNIEC
jgi:hypothetical protein